MKRCWLKEARTVAGFTQQELAVELEISIGTVQKWEAGLLTPRPCHARELDRVLGCGGSLKSRFDAERKAARDARFAAARASSKVPA